MKTLIIGVGAIGGCLGGWLSEVHDEVYLYDVPEVAETLEEKGITLFLQGAEDDKKNVKVKVISDLGEVPEPDIVAIAVKNYNLEEVCELVKEKVLGDPIVLGFQNGIINQSILPKYFDRVIFTIIEFNAWIEEPGVIGYQNKGPFVLGALEGMEEELKQVKDYFSAAVATEVTNRVRDAAYCKMVINLTNSFTTLVGFKYREIESMPLFKKILSTSMYEGVQIVKAAGVTEYKVETMPGWGKIRASATLPDFITNGIFKKNLEKMVLSSMAQDIIQRKSHISELDTLVGHFIELANKHGIPAPYNKTIYGLCKREFGKPVFSPMTETAVWKEIEKALK